MRKAFQDSRETPTFCILTMSSVDLKLNSDLLNPQFEGYRLSLDPLATFTTKFDVQQLVGEARVSSTQYSFQHMKAFGSYNHLFLDPYNEDNIYWASTSTDILHVNVKNCNPRLTIHCVFSLPDADPVKSISSTEDETSAPVSFSLTSDTLAVVSNGQSVLYLVNTGPRFDQQQQWEVLQTFPRSDSIGDPLSSFLLDSILCTVEGKEQTHCLVYHIEVSKDESEASDREPNYKSTLTIVTLYHTDSSTYTVNRYLSLQGLNPPDYASLHRAGTHLVICSQQPYQVIRDSTKELLKEEPESSAHHDDLPPYKWHQTPEDVTIMFDLDRDLTRTDVTCKLMTESIDLSVKDFGVLLVGSFPNKICVDESAWSINKNRLELVLSKAEEDQQWSEVVIGDKRGENITDIPSMQNFSNFFDPKPAYNSQLLEDCDVNPDDDAVLMHFNLETHLTTHMVHLGHRQFLFMTRRTGDHPGVVCLRHDVDGIIWQQTDYIKNESSPWQHTATFDALGYHSASKEKKFMSCSPDFSYSVLADCSRHIYILRQHNDVQTLLRNRKSGQKVSTVAKQNLITLEDKSNIVGLCATKHHVCVLCKDALHVINV